MKRSTLILSHKQVLGAFAAEAVRLSPYAVPDDLEDVLRALHEYLLEKFPSITPVVDMMETTDVELSARLNTFVHAYPSVQPWNKRKNGDQSPYQYVDAYSGRTHPDADFIDLDAMHRNIMHTLTQEGRAGKLTQPPSELEDVLTSIENRGLGWTLRATRGAEEHHGAYIARVWYLQDSDQAASYLGIAYGSTPLEAITNANHAANHKLRDEQKPE